jgi:hypothetical protein
MALILRAWNSSRAKVDTTTTESPLLRAPKHVLVVSESLTIPSSSSPASSSPEAYGQDDALYENSESTGVHATKNYFDFPGCESASPTPSQHGYILRRVNIQDNAYNSQDRLRHQSTLPRPECPHDYFWNFHGHVAWTISFMGTYHELSRVSCT